MTQSQLCAKCSAEMGNRMELENLLMILIAVCGLLALETGVILGVVIRNGKIAAKNVSAMASAPAPVAYSRNDKPVNAAPAAQAAVSSQPKRQEGQVICRSCYNAISMHSRTCTCCGAMLDGRR